jgi:limonene 1,2-monooxygenase
MARFVHPHFQNSRESRRDSYAHARDHHAEFAGQAGAAVQAEIDRLAAKRKTAG